MQCVYVSVCVYTVYYYCNIILIILNIKYYILEKINNEY